MSVNEELLAEVVERFPKLISRPKFVMGKPTIRPPFAYIVDIVKSLTAAHGFAEGLYTDEEIENAKGIKIEYLNRLIQCVELTLGTQINVEVTNITKGKEVNETLEFFLQIADIVERQLDTRKAVNQILGIQDDEEPELEMDVRAQNSPEPPQEEPAMPERRDSPVEPERPEVSMERHDVVMADSPSPEPEMMHSGMQEAEPKDYVDYGDEVPQFVQETQLVVGDLLFDGTNGNVGSLKKGMWSWKRFQRPPFKWIRDLLLEIRKKAGFPYDPLFNEDMWTFNPGPKPSKDGSESKEEFAARKSEALKSKAVFVGLLVNAVRKTFEDEEEWWDVKPAKILSGDEAENTNYLLRKIVEACTVKREKALQVAREFAPSNEQSEPEEQEMMQSSGGQDMERRTPSSPVPMPETQREEQNRPMSGPKAEEDDGVFGGGIGGGSSGNSSSSSRGNSSRNTSSGRPQTAGRPPPSVEENARQVGRNQTMGAGGLGTLGDAPQIGEGRPNGGGFMELGDDNDSDDDIVIVEQEDPMMSHGHAAADDGQHHGRLVQDILSTKAQGQETSGNQGNTWNKEQSKRQRAAKKEEIEALQESIQTLCKGANPIGRVMEYMQEDFDAMAKEFEFWKEEYRQRTIELEEVKKSTEQSLLAKRKQMEQVEREIREQREKLQRLKATVLQNDSRVQKRMNQIVQSVGN